MDMNPESRNVFSEVCSFYSQILKILMFFRMSTSHTSCFQHDADFVLNDLG